MALLTAREAARRLGKDERTIRRWVAAGKLQQRQSASNRLAIDEQDLERLAAQLTAADLEKRQVISDLQARITELELEQARILARLALLEDRPAVAPERASRPAGEIVYKPRPARPRVITEQAAPGDIPPGSRQATEFALAHGINRVTFRDHMTLGIRGEKVEHIAIFKREKKDGSQEFDRWLSPEQQAAAVAFWNRHETDWQKCDLPDCLICGNQGALSPENDALGRP